MHSLIESNVFTSTVGEVYGLAEGSIVLASNNSLTASLIFNLCVGHNLYRYVLHGRAVADLEIF